MSGESFKITPQPEYEMLHAFDAANGVEPCRTIAERIAASHGISAVHPLVDDISEAIENAMDSGQRRAAFLPVRNN